MWGHHHHHRHHPHHRFLAYTCFCHARYNATCTANSTLKCPLNYASGVGTAFGRTSVPLSDDSCAEETLEEVYWQVEVGITRRQACDFLSCDAPPCFVWVDTGSVLVVVVVVVVMVVVVVVLIVSCCCC